jgi:hypothetical protein
MSFATREDVKQALRMLEGEDDDDALIDQIVMAATGAVVNYLKAGADPYLDSGGSVPSGVEVPSVIRSATIILACYLYRNPDQDPEKSFERGYLPAPVAALLYPLRDPALA